MARQCLIILVCLLGLNPVYAWEYEDYNGPPINPFAEELSNEITQFPQPLFLTDSDREKLSQLLDATLLEQNGQIKQFRQAIDLYKKTKLDSSWEVAESSYYTLGSLNKSKQELLRLSARSVRDEYTGFGPIGVTQFRYERELTRLNIEYLTYFQIRSFAQLFNDLLISPVPVVVVVLKVFAIYLLLTWWLRNSRRLVSHFKENQLSSTQSPPLWMRVLWYLSKANKAIAWLIALTISLRILADVSSLQHLVFLEIFTWWILGGSIAISFILEFVAHNSHTQNQSILALRLSTVRIYVWSAIVAGVTLQIAERTLGKGTIYYWLSHFLYVWFLIITLHLLRKWKPTVFGKADKLGDKPVWVLWAIRNKDTFGIGLLATLFTALWIVSQSLLLWIITSLSDYTIFSQALAYLFRIEVAKQSGVNGINDNLVRIKGEDAFRYILPGNESSELIDYGSAELKQLGKFLLSDSPAVCIVSGERGIGTTTLLKQLLHKVKNARPIYLNCPHAGYKELLQDLAGQLGLDAQATEIQILAFLRKSDESILIALDNAQRLVKPKVGGLAELMKFTNLLRRSKGNHRAVLAIEKASWRFVDRARGERLLFDWVTFMPRWSERQIGKLLDSRIDTSLEHPVTFEGLVVPKQWDQESLSEGERARQGFYRILWHYADGNPTVALRFFRLSIRRNKETDAVVVRLFHAPESDELEQMPKPMLAVLRSIVQIEIASPEELSDCTQLSISEVIGTLRYFQSRGFIEWSEDKARVSDHWFRHITNVLHRQHLLVK